MIAILGIDPGPEESGYAIIYGDSVIECGVLCNMAMSTRLRAWEYEVAIEMIASYGMAVGAEVFDTCVWIGRFWEICKNDPILLKRKEVVTHLCGTPKGKDANVRQALIDMFPGTGGGKVPQIGTKKKPGPLFGISSHMWPALGVAITARDTK